MFYKVPNKTNETVSLGDTAISLYTPAPTTWRGRGDQAGTPDPLKFQVPRSTQIFFGGGGKLQTNIPEILEWRHSRNFEQNIC